MDVEQYSRFVKGKANCVVCLLQESCSRTCLQCVVLHQSSVFQSRRCKLLQSLLLIYIACQTRDGDLNISFAHGNQSIQLSLSLGGKIRLATKADLHCLESEEIQERDNPVVNAKIVDDATVVQMFWPGTAKTFQDYAVAVFIPYIFSVR